jgi:hypothetical protein
MREFNESSALRVGMVPRPMGDHVVERGGFVTTANHVVERGGFVTTANHVVERGGFVTTANHVVHEHGTDILVREADFQVESVTEFRQSVESKTAAALKEIFTEVVFHIFEVAAHVHGLSLALKLAECLVEFCRMAIGEDAQRSENIERVGP